MKHTLSTVLALGMVGALACGPATKAEKTFPGDTNTEVDTEAFDENGNSDPQAPELAFPAEAFRAEQPAGTAPRSFRLPSIQTFKLGKQIDVYLIEQHDLPIVSIDLNFEGGSMNDPSTKVGLGGVCMALMSEGTSKLDKLAFRAALADTASRVSSYASNETQGVTMSTLTKHFDTTLPLFRDTLLSPGFRKTDLDRMIKRRLESLKQAKASANSVAGRVSDRVLYGAAHPFGKVTTEKTLGSITVADCSRYHKAYIKPRGAKLYVVGDMTKEQVVAKFSPLLKSWRGTPRRSARLGKPRSAKGKLFFVDIPKSAQSVVYIMHFGPQRKDPGFFSNSIMSSILGGSFPSRVNMNLREDKGYSYGARARLGYSRSYGEMVGSSSVRANATRQSVLEFFKEIRNLKIGNVPPTAAELSREKNGAILSLPGRFSTSRASLSRYRSLVYYGLPLDYYNSYVEGVSSVTLEQVKAAAAKHLDPDGALVLVVGDGEAEQIYRNADDKDVPLVDDKGKPVTLRKALEQLAAFGELGKGALVELDADGNPKK